MAAWLRHQADEEIVHANKFIDHVVDRDNHARIGAVRRTRGEGRAVPLGIFETSLAHEHRLQAIRDLYRRDRGRRRPGFPPLLNWFLNEQIEEEATVGEIIGRIKLIGSDGSGLLRLDAELGKAYRPTG